MTVRVTAWTRLPAMAVTVIVNVPLCVPWGMLIVSIEVPDPPGDSVTGFTLNDVPKLEGAVTDSITLPVKPCRLISASTNVPEWPIRTGRIVGEPEREKSGGTTTFTDTSTDCCSGPLTPVTVTV